MLLSFSALLGILASAAAVHAKVILLNKPVLYKDYPAACKKHGAEPINVHRSDVDTMLNLIKKVTGKQKVQKSKIKGWIAAYESSTLKGTASAFGYAQSYDVPSLVILDAEAAQAQKITRISFCWVEQEESKDAVENAHATDDLHVDMTSPDVEEPQISEARKDKSRRRNAKSKKSHKKESSSSSDNDTHSGSDDEPSSDSEPKKNRRQKSRHIRNKKH